MYNARVPELTPLPITADSMKNALFFGFLNAKKGKPAGDNRENRIISPFPTCQVRLKKMHLIKAALIIMMQRLYTHEVVQLEDRSCPGILGSQPDHNITGLGRPQGNTMIHDAVPTRIKFGPPKAIACRACQARA
jgi:hypothetical protein